MGKSEVLRELQTRGLKAYGVDEDSFGDWVNRNSGEIEVLEPKAGEGFNIHDWYKNHAWVLSKERIGQIANQANADNLNVFLCGTADGFDDCSNLFSKVVALHMDDPITLAARIQQREDIDFGKDPAELNRILEWQNNAEPHFRTMGAVILNASKPVQEIVDELLMIVADSQ